METEKVLNSRILKMTILIQEYYPELYRNLNEMFATLPNAEIPVITNAVLHSWLETLTLLVKQYDAARRP